MPQAATRRSFLKRSGLSLLAASRLAQAGGGRSSSRAADWRYYGGDQEATRYSGLDRINRSNVTDLKVAWTHNTGDSRNRPVTTIECTPLVVDGVMYITTAQLQFRALNAATGEVLWNFDPFEGVRLRRSKGVNRGVTYWEDEEGKDRRIFVAAHHKMYCLRAENGKLVSEFADGGALDLRQGMDREVAASSYVHSTPPVVFEDLLILGGSGGEGPAPAWPGHIRGYDVRTGKRRWIFHTVPLPGEFGYDTWGKESWKTAGGANNWAGMSVDTERGLVFASTGSPTFDFYGGDRPGENLYGNCVIALNARTGERVWHYQTVHHDLWDYDLPAQPALVSTSLDGKRVDLVAQVTKTGFLFVFERETGKPLFPIEERPVPKSDIPGETAWLTQPFPLKPLPFARQGLSDDNVTDRTPEAREYVMRQLKDLRNEGLFTPPSKRGTVLFPGTLGGGLWGGCSFDPASGWVYINSSNAPKTITILDANPEDPFPYRHGGYPYFTDQDGYSAAKPPWGQLTAIDLSSGDHQWQIPLGEHPDLAAQGKRPTGTFNVGGSIVTAGGVLFIGATRDEKFRAFDSKTGKLLWEHQLNAGAYATPCTYEIGERQYVAIAAGGGGKGRTKAGDEFVVFTLG